MDWPLYFNSAAVVSFFLSFFLAYCQRSRRLDVYHTSTHGVALVRISGLDQQHSTEAPRTFGIGPHSIVVLVQDKHIPNAAYRWKQLLRQQQHSLNSTIQVTVKPRLHNIQPVVKPVVKPIVQPGLTTG